MKRIEEMMMKAGRSGRGPMSGILARATIMPLNNSQK
jgi:hypothetical protein